MRRHLDGCAAMRCLGVSQATLRALFTLEFVGVGVAGGALGVALGFLGHLALLTWLGSLIDVELPYPTVWPALQGIAAGLVLRREWGEAGRTAWAAYALGIVLFAALLIVAAGELKLGGIVAGGLLVFACIASALQITALGIGLMCLLLIAMTRNDLVAGWRKSTPPDAPNEFIIDIQPDQREPVTHYLDTRGVSGTVLSPMVRGRLTAINGKPVNPDSFKGDDAKRLVDREFNLSYTTQLPDDNRISAGTWYGDAKKPQISIEEGLAKLINVKPGNVLRFDVTGLQIDAPVTSVRKLDWGSFKVNFFVLMPPAALQDFPATFITSFHLPPEKRATIDSLIAAYPNLTAIDTGPILAQVQRVLEQVIGAVQFLFAFTLAAGVLVLYAALAGTRDERMRESALLRAGRVARAGAHGADC
ncbi:MAG: ABC transporter, permease protein [uncultured Paraburkholderia sp.]|nr:MAG: ABC transporter, permease protein [uncultured Paraburkholderia sp.]